MSPLHGPAPADASMSMISDDATPPPLKATDALPALRPPVTPAVSNELAALHRAVLAAATAENTRTAYRQSIRHFLDWGGLLPSTEAEVIRYLMDFAPTQNPRTLSLRLTALSQWHIQQQLANPAATSTVRKTMKGILRLYGRPKQKAKALLVDDLERLVGGLVAVGTPKALRDSALLQLGFFGGFRRSELVGINVEHVTWEPAGIVITLPRSKTDQEGQGIVKAIPYAPGGPLCPATALRAWLAVAGIANGPVFQGLGKWGHLAGKRLRAAAVNDILASAARQAKLDYAPDLSSHSLRRGMATSAHRAGARFEDIKRQGGWRHDGTVQGYIEESKLFTDNAASSILRSRADTKNTV